MPDAYTCTQTHTRAHTHRDRNTPDNPPWTLVSKRPLTSCRNGHRVGGCGGWLWIAETAGNLQSPSVAGPCSELFQTVHRHTTIHRELFTQTANTSSSSPSTCLFFFSYPGSSQSPKPPNPTPPPTHPAYSQRFTQYGGGGGEDGSCRKQYPVQYYLLSFRQLQSTFKGTVEALVKGHPDEGCTSIFLYM